MLRFVNTGIVFQEIPDEVTLSINISNCPCRCPGCHSKYLWDDVGEPLTIDVIDNFINENHSDITCVCFMGGDSDAAEVCRLAKEVKDCHQHIKVAWYSGRQRIPSFVDKTAFDYVKLGPYLRHLGGLKSPKTNQRLYKKELDGGFLDITSRFWK